MNNAKPILCKDLIVYLDHSADSAHLSPYRTRTEEDPQNDTGRRHLPGERKVDPGIDCQQEFKVSYLTYKTFRRDTCPSLMRRGPFLILQDPSNPLQTMGYKLFLQQTVNYIGGINLTSRSVLQAAAFH